MERGLALERFFLIIQLDKIRVHFHKVMKDFSVTWSVMKQARMKEGSAV